MVFPSLEFKEILLKQCQEYNIIYNKNNESTWREESVSISFRLEAEHLGPGLATYMCSLTHPTPHFIIIIFDLVCTWQAC